MSVARTLHVVLRHVHQKAEARSRDPHKVRPEWFSYETCFRNLLQTIRRDPMAAQVKVLILFDGSMEEFVEDFAATYYADRSLGLSVEFIRGGSNGATFLIALEMVRTSSIPDTDLIYFLENDYMHRHGWVSKLFELYDSAHKPDFVSLYDHRDKYDFEMYAGLRERLVYSATHHWRTVPSTCGTFVLEKSAVLKDYDVWTANLFDYVLFPTLIEQRGRVLLTPLPGLATHSMSGYLSPTIDWADVAQQANTDPLP